MAEQVKCLRVLKNREGEIVSYRISDGIKEKDASKESLEQAIKDGLIEVENLKLKTNIQKYEDYK